MTMTHATADAPESPKFLRPNCERMPPELTQRPNWVLWAPIWKGSKWTKRPIQVSGFGASTTNPKHWSSFDDVKQAYERAVERGYIELRQKGKPHNKFPSAASVSCSMDSRTRRGSFLQGSTSTRSFQLTTKKLPRWLSNASRD